MKRNFRVLLLLTLISVQASNAIIMTGEGITTEKGFLSWENFYTMADRLDRVEKIQKLFIFGTVVCVGAFIYLKWFNDQTEHSLQKAISDLDDIESSNAFID